MKSIMVVGIGNYILQDEGVGVHVVNHLKEMELPEQVSLVDGGTHSYDLVDFFCQADIIIVVDALKAGGEPGTIYRAPLEDLGLKKDENSTSLHQMSFIEAVQMVNLLGHHPQITVFGVEPKTIDWGLELTPEISAKLPRLVELVTEEIQNHIANQ